MLHDNTGQELQSPNFKMSEKEKLDKSFKRTEVASTKLITRYDKVHENLLSKDKLNVCRKSDIAQHCRNSLCHQRLCWGDIETRCF